MACSSRGSRSGRSTGRPARFTEELALKSLLLVAFAALAPAAQDPTPAPAPVQKPAPKPVYDESADGSAQIDAALARAKRDNRRVLVQWGASWCGWCKLLDATCKSDAGLAHEILYESASTRETSRPRRRKPRRSRWGSAAAGGTAGGALGWRLMRRT